MKSLGALGLGLLSAAVVAQESVPRIEAVATVALGELVAAHAARDLDGDGRFELVTVAPGGQVEIHGLRGGRMEVLGQPVALSRPDASVLALADLDEDGDVDLVVLGTDGLWFHPLGDGPGFDSEAREVSAAARLGFRTGAPVFVDFLLDLNVDGRADLLVPRGEVCELWLRDVRAGEISFSLSQSLPVDFGHSMRSRADALTDTLVNRVRVPSLDILDVNGDGRPDLRVEEGQRRRFFLQGADGTFAAEPIELDLGIFVDTTPRASVQLGRTAVLTDRQQYQSGDLDGDGILDHVIAHRRKVWSFLGAAEGPQFTDASTRMVAEDVSGLLLMRVDDDARDDLLVFKVDVPSAGELVVGLVSSLDVPIRVIGYRTDEEGRFEDRATWSRELTLRAPSILGLLREAEDLVRRFTEVLAKFRWSALGDFDGDGADDLALIGEDGTALELFLKPEGNGEVDRAAERWLRDLLFENPDTVFDLDRLLDLVAQVFDTRTASMTGEREPDARAVLSVAEGRFVRDFEAVDLDGDGRAELVVLEADEAEPRRLTCRVLRWVVGTDKGETPR
ncbi:MAG: VCBS repeat-containing protein [Planctomycetota bacterium]|nr:VCBS repeat-containing protein [Planctomycetota bacterium]